MNVLVRDKKVLMLFAHPDDEIICGWPVLQQKDVEKIVLICSNDANNPEREWCKHRGAALHELMHALDIPYICLDFNSGFYRMPTRPKPELSETLRCIRDEASAVDCDMIFTHNPMGEYGHVDHVLIHQLAMTLGKPVLVTDMFVPMNWVPYQKFGNGFERMYGRSAHCGTEVSDLAFYQKCENVYRKHNVWTWCKLPVPKCELYML